MLPTAIYGRPKIPSRQRVCGGGFRKRGQCHRCRIGLGAFAKERRIPKSRRTGLAECSLSSRTRIAFGFALISCSQILTTFHPSFLSKRETFTSPRLFPKSFGRQDLSRALRSRKHFRRH